MDESVGRVCLRRSAGIPKRRPEVIGSWQSGNSFKPIFRNQGQELEGSSMGMLFASLPLTHQSCGHIKITGETAWLAPSRNRSARISLGFSGRTGVRHRSSNSRIVTFVHDGGGVKTFGGLTDRRQKRTTILLAHRMRSPTTSHTGLINNDRTEPAGFSLARPRNPLFDNATPKIGANQSAFDPLFLKIRTCRHPGSGRHSSSSLISGTLSAIDRGRDHRPVGSTGWQSSASCCANRENPR